MDEKKDIGITETKKTLLGYVMDGCLSHLRPLDNHDFEVGLTDVLAECVEQSTSRMSLDLRIFINAWNVLSVGMDSVIAATCVMVSRRYGRFDYPTVAMYFKSFSHS